MVTLPSFEEMEAAFGDGAAFSDSGTFGSSGAFGDEATLGGDPLRYTPTSFIELCNEALEYAYSTIEIIGEVASFKINQGKWVFFDLKDEESSLPCFMPVWDLRCELTDGMKVILRATPKLTKWGKFSLTVRRIQPVGQGSIKKSFDLLKQKLSNEGLFDPSKKRPIPDPISELAVISSTEAAGYADFIKILNERWGGIHVEVAHTQVQGLDAPDQIIQALGYFNQKAKAEAIVIIRGGGSKDDLSVFNDEALVRAIAASRIPVATGIGHEVDESLADLAADLRASTPSNAAQLITRDRRAEIDHLHSELSTLVATLKSRIDSAFTSPDYLLADAYRQIVVKITTLMDRLKASQRILAAVNPDQVLSQGYAIISGKISPGETLKITTIDKIIETEVKHVQTRN